MCQVREKYHHGKGPTHTTPVWYVRKSITSPVLGDDHPSHQTRPPANFILEVEHDNERERENAKDTSLL